MRVPVPAVLVPHADTLASMARNRRIWNKFGRFISGVVVACFFLPFFGVSCQGMDVITISGTDMVGGCKPGGLITEAADKKSGHGARMSSSETSGLDVKIDKVDREPLAIVALALVLAGFGLAWVRTRPALVFSGVLALAALGVLGALYVKVSREIDTQVNKEVKDKHGAGELGGTGARMVEDMKIDAGGRFGLWLTCLGLLAIATITLRAVKEPDAPAGPPPGALPAEAAPTAPLVG